MSVDPQLWKMLARKIGTLGKVIDGENNASMNAKEDPTNGIPRQSAQDELQSFFADTSPNDTSTTGAPKVPIKGTIMSFFKKQNESQMNEQQPKITTSSPREIISPSPFVQSIKKHMKATTSSPLMAMVVSPKQSTIEWACDKCTFINSQLRAKSGWLKCSMCGERYFEKSSPTVTPNNTQSSQEDPIVLDDSDEDEKVPGSTLKNSPGNPKKRQRTKPSSRDCDVVVLDTDRDSQVHNEPLRKQLPKRPKVGAEDIICLDETDDTTKSQVKAKPNEPLSARSVLSFSVSKNSGRITIHFAGSNEASQVNFSPEQVLTEETANRLLDTKIHRRSSNGLGIPLEFDMEAINQGKLVASCS